VTEDIEGDVGQESTGDAPSSEPSSDPAEELSSEIRRSIDTQRERGPDGKFVRSEGKEGGAAKGIATGTATADSGTPKGVGRRQSGGAAIADEPRSAIRPPPGFSVAAKQAWDSLPEAVKADISKREAEVNAGLQRYGGLKAYADEAERNGKSLQAAVHDYVTVEHELGKDAVGGIEYLCRRLNWQPIEVLKAWLSKYIPYRGQNGGQIQPQYQQPVDPNMIASHAANMVRMEFQRGQIDNDIAAFSANPANRFFPNVRQDMAILVQAGKAVDLQTAYEAACWMHPEIRAILLQDAAGGNRGAARTAQRAQNAAKAVTGAPGNSHAGEPPRRKDLTLDEEIRANIAAQKGLS
jgi:hypothetical protein